MSFEPVCTRNMSAEAYGFVRVDRRRPCPDIYFTTYGLSRGRYLPDEVLVLIYRLVPYEFTAAPLANTCVLLAGLFRGKPLPRRQIFLEEIADHIAFCKSLNVGTSHPQVRRTSESLPCWDICLPKSKNKSDSLPWGIQL